MQLSEILKEEKVIALKPQVEAAGLDFEQQVEVAIVQANAKQYVSVNTEEQIILCVVEYLVKLIADNVQPKKKVWKGFWKVIPAIVSAIGSVFTKKK